ncbi:hypothetical protein EVAR_69959_1, partial [Eumeta japonica]
MFWGIQDPPSHNIEILWNHREVEKCLHSIFPYSDISPKATANNKAAQAASNVAKESPHANSPLDDHIKPINDVNFTIDAVTTEQSKPPTSYPSDIQIH